MSLSPDPSTHSGVSQTSASPVTNDNYANGASTGSHQNMGEADFTIRISAPSPETSQRAYNALMNDLSSTGDMYYDMFTYTNLGGISDTAYEWYNGDISGWEAAGELGMAALFGGAGVRAYRGATNLVTHLSYAEKYGGAGYRTLQNGRIRYYGEINPSRNLGTMKGRRYVHEYDPTSGRTRGWHETIDHDGNVRIVRPEMNNGIKTHYYF